MPSNNSLGLIMANHGHQNSPCMGPIFTPPINPYSPEPTFCSPSSIDPTSSSFFGIPNFGFKDNAPAPWPNMAPTQAAAGYFFDPSFSPYGFPGAGFDYNNATRRKNVTRDSTSILKAWLNDHRKNPYPTKAEKIMLAIITKMTLTQVSTWFANARRRLKKENKMTWSPRNRCDDDDDGGDDDGSDARSSDFRSDMKDSALSSITNGDSDIVDIEDESSQEISDRKRVRNCETPPSMVSVAGVPLTVASIPGSLVVGGQLNGPSLISPLGGHQTMSDGVTGCMINNLLPTPVPVLAPIPPPSTKPRIWSIVDMATSSRDEPVRAPTLRPPIGGPHFDWYSVRSVPCHNSAL